MQLTDLLIAVGLGLAWQVAAWFLNRPGKPRPNGAESRPQGLNGTLS